MTNLPILKADQPQDSQPPAPGLPTLGGTGLGTQGPVPLTGLGGLIERQLGSPTRFDLPAVQEAYKFLGGEMGREYEKALGQADVTSAQRGTFFGTPGTSARERLGSDYQRGLGTLASNLLLEQARTGASDQSQAIQNAMQFGGQQLGADQFAAQQALNTLGAGELGTPQANPAAAQLAGQPLPQLGPNPWESLGEDFGNLLGSGAFNSVRGQQIRANPEMARIAAGGPRSLPQIGQGSMPGVGGLPTNVSGPPLPRLPRSSYSFGS